MKTEFKTNLVMCLLVLLFSTATAIAQTCKPDSIKATTQTSRFTDNGDGTVTDLVNGLMWKKSSEGQADDCSGSATTYTWREALMKAKYLNSNGGFAGYTDWRLPNIKELHSLVEERCYDPAINLSVFPNTPPGLYWSSSPVAADSFVAWSVDFLHGNDSLSYKINYNYVRLVRGGR